MDAAYMTPDLERYKAACISKLGFIEELKAYEYKALQNQEIIDTLLLKHPEFKEVKHERR